MTFFSFPERNIELLADEYAWSRTSLYEPISISAAIVAVRTRVPNSTHTDKELAAIIAARAVEQGHAVDFDAA